ncbi:MAG: class I SAM-dependent rRNA methyltransferase [Polyangiales bacterium]
MSRSIASVHLRKGHVQPIWAGHPWVYAQAIDRVEVPGGGATPGVGDEVRVVDPQGNALGRGFWSPRRAIPVRLLVRDETTSLDDAQWLVDRIEAARRRRRSVGLPSAETTGYRLLHAEGDDAPGLVMDHFGAGKEGRGGVVVVQVGTAGLYARAERIIEALNATVAPDAILDRTSESSARGEGFEIDARFGDPARVEALRFSERGLRFSIPRDVGQKTGFYFDQRDLRARIESVARDRRVLDAYSYVGPIAMAAARGGAKSVLAVDDSLRALEVGDACAKDNALTIEFRRGDVRKELPKLAAEGQRFDLVVLDPPKLAPTRGDRDGAAHYTSKLVEAACAVTEASGLMVICSCSTALGAGVIPRSHAIGARRAGRRAPILDRLGQGADHPVPAAFPEGIYLSTILAEIG